MKTWAIILALQLGIAASAYAQSYDCEDYVQKPAVNALIKAGDHGLSGPYAVGIIMSYGSGNVSSPPEVGDFLIGLIDKETRSRTELPVGVEFDSQYFIECLPSPGIGITFMLGGDSIGPLDVFDTVEPETIRELVDLRITTTRLLYNGLPDGG